MRTEVRTEVQAGAGTQESRQILWEGGPELQEVGRFFADYAAWLLGAGATCLRIEKSIGRIADVMGVRTEMTIFPTLIMMTVSTKDESATWSTSHAMHHRGIDYTIIARLSRLSWDMSEGRVNFAEAREVLSRISYVKPAPDWALIPFVSAANASFCRLFSGDWTSMAIVFFATLIGYWLKQTLLKARVDARVVYICCSFCSAVISAGCHLFGWGNTPQVALGCSVLYLIPGIIYINSLSDLLDGHYVCAYSRFMNAAILTACLTIGLSGGIILLGLDI